MEKNAVTAIACEFCQMPDSLGTKAFQALYQENQILNIPNFPKDFFVAQDVASIGVQGGHLLLIPRRHALSFAAIPSHLPSNEAVEDLAALLQNLYPSHSIFFFEHGAGFLNGQSIACGGCHIDHAHAHFVILPTEAEFTDIQSATIGELQRAGWDNITQLPVPTIPFVNLSSLVRTLPYLYAGMIRGDHRTASIIPQQKKEKPIESQLYRKIISTVIYSRPDATFWNWRDIVLGYTTDERLASLKNGVIELRRRLAYALATKKHHHFVASS